MATQDTTKKLDRKFVLKMIKALNTITNVYKKDLPKTETTVFHQKK